MLTTIVSSPLKNLQVVIDPIQNVLVELHYTNKRITRHIPSHRLLQETCKQLQLYFDKPSAPFTLPIELLGTAHQKKLWHALCKIPYGETRTYGELAKQLNSSAQAIGNACRANPIAIIVPCHRVVAKTGLGGYNGKTQGKMLSIKEWLLKHEGVI